jgi:hypothetical protein
MTSDSLTISGDLISYAASFRAEEIRRVLLTRALEYLEDDKLASRAETEDVCRVAILNGALAIQHDAWGLDPKFGDPTLTWPEYRVAHAALIRNEIDRLSAVGFPLLSFDPCDAAIQNVLSRHGLAAVISFLKECWKNNLILSEDGFFRPMFIAIRAEAFDLDWSSCGEEIRTAEKRAQDSSQNQEFSILARARELAKIDKEKSRTCGRLEGVVRRENREAELALARARAGPFSVFLRLVSQIKPVYYTLRDAWYELHFLSANRQQQEEFEYLECFADERQADIGQMFQMPCGAPMLSDVAGWGDLTPSARRRRLRFWLNSRVQLNDELSCFLEEHIPRIGPELSATSLASELADRIEMSLDEGLRIALSIIRDQLAAEAEGRSNES